MNYEDFKYKLTEMGFKIHPTFTESECLTYQDVICGWLDNSYPIYNNHGTKIGHELYFRNASALKLARPATLRQLSNQEITPINYSKWTKFKTEDFLAELQKKVKVYLVTVRKCQMEMDFKCLD